MDHVLHVPYNTSSVSDVLRQFDIYFSPTRPLVPSPLICFIHGGAWRSEDKRDHTLLATRLRVLTGCAVAVPNYRLSPKDSHAQAFTHPQHAEDVLAFLTYISSCPVIPNVPHGIFDTSKIYLMGHSCSAHMIASILLDSSASFPSLTPTGQLLQAIRGVVFSEGIYDIDALLSQFPDYRAWFIEAAFGKSESYGSASVTKLKLRVSHITWFLVHSKGDTLVDMPQSLAMYDHLYRLCGMPSDVQKDVNSLSEDHNAILEGTEFPRLVSDFISRVEVEKGINM